MVAPKISILIICYNQAKLISRAIDSLLCQKDYIYEICVSDDCSKDGTWDVLIDYQRQYPDIFKLHRQPVNKGIFENIEQVWRMPTGNMMYLLAGDDECGDGWFESVTRLVEQEKVNCERDAFCVYGDYMAVYPSGDTLTLSNRRILSSNDAVGLALRHVINSRSVCYSKGVWEKLIPVSQGRSYAAETAQDFQLQVWSKTNFYIPQVGNIYYTGVGVSVNANRKETPKIISTPMELVIKVLDKASHRLSKSDWRLVEYFNLRAHRRYRNQIEREISSIESIFEFVRLKLLYVGSIQLRHLPFHTKRIAFAVLRRLPHIKPLKWRIN